MVENLHLSAVPLRRGIPPAQLSAWADRYKTTVRTIRRWLADGEACGDPCPLDDPKSLKEWWAKHKTWRLPDSISAAAASSSPSVATPEAAPVESINLTDFSLQDGAAVIQARALVAVAYNQLEKAYRLGGDVDALLKKHEKALEALRKAESSDREAAKQRGDLIRREVIEADASTAVRMLKQMRENMVRLVLEQLPDLGEDIKTRVSATIDRVRRQEESIFRNLVNVPQQHTA